MDDSSKTPKVSRNVVIAQLISEIADLKKEKEVMECQIGMYREHFDTHGTIEPFHRYIERKMKGDTHAYEGEVGHILYERDRTIIYLLDMHEFYERGLKSLLRGMPYPAAHIDSMILQGRGLAYQSLHGMEPGVVCLSYSKGNQTKTSPHMSTFETGEASMPVAEYDPQYVNIPLGTTTVYPAQTEGIPIDESWTRIDDYLLNPPDVEFVSSLFWDGLVV